MARFSLSYRISETTGDADRPSAEWVKKNKNTAKFKKIVKSAWSIYFLKLNGFYTQKWNKAPERENSSKVSIVNFGETYRRARVLDQDGHRAKIVDRDTSMYLSGNLKKTVSSCQLKFDKGRIRILTPAFKKDYIDLDKDVNGTTWNSGDAGDNGLSEFLEDEFSFDSTSLPSGFNKGEPEYENAVAKMNLLLKKEEQRQLGRKKR